MRTAYLFRFLLFSVILLLSGCGSDDDSQILTRIVIESSNGSRLDIINQEETTLTASGFDQSDNPMEITSTTEWTADNANVTIDQEGKVTSQAVGTSLITATVDNVEGTFNIRVWDSTAPGIEIYVSDVGEDRNGPHQIIRYDEYGETSAFFIQTAVSKPQDIVFLEDQGVLLVSNLSTNNINKFDIETGGSMGSFATGLSQPTRIDIGPDGLLYVAPWGGGVVKRFQLDGTFVDDFTTIGIIESIGLAWDSDNNLYVASFNSGNGNGFVRKFSPSGEDLGLFISSNLSGPTDIWFDDAGNLFVNDWAGNSVKRFDSDGNFLGVFISNVSQPEGVAILDDGSILIGASGSSSVEQYNSDGTFIKSFIPNGVGGLVTPNAVVIRKVNQ